MFSDLQTSGYQNDSDSDKIRFPVGKSHSELLTFYIQVSLSQAQQQHNTVIPVMSTSLLGTQVPCQDLAGPIVDVISAGHFKELSMQNNPGTKQNSKKSHVNFF